MKSKSVKQRQQERTRRRADIRRGMKIALYEVNQTLAPLGIRLEYPPAFVPYTVALAEGHRRDATPQDKFSAFMWNVATHGGLVVLG